MKDTFKNLFKKKLVITINDDFNIINDFTKL